MLVRRTRMKQTDSECPGSIHRLLKLIDLVSCRTNCLIPNVFLRLYFNYASAQSGLSKIPARRLVPTPSTICTCRQAYSGKPMMKFKHKFLSICSRPRISISFASLFKPFLITFSRRSRVYRQHHLEFSNSTFSGFGDGLIEKESKVNILSEIEHAGNLLPLAPSIRQLRYTGHYPNRR